MRIFIYIMVLAVVAMLYKTFYWDYQPKEVASEVNTSIETPVESESEDIPVKTIEAPKDNTADEQNRTGWQSRKGMPIEKLGDSIGHSLKDKIKVK